MIRYPGRVARGGRRNSRRPTRPLSAQRRAVRLAGVLIAVSRLAGACDFTTEEFLSAFGESVAGSGSGCFVRLTDGETARRFERLTEALLADDAGAAEGELAGLSASGILYESVRLTGAAGAVSGFMEATAPCEPGYRGWGAVLVRPGSSGRVVYQAPHVKADLYTEEIALRAFVTNPHARVLMLAGAHRNASGDADGDGANDSDVAHDTDNLFHLLTAYLARRGDAEGAAFWYVQFHGAENREGEPDIVGADGSDCPVRSAADALVRVDDAVDGGGHAGMGVCGWVEGPGDEEDGDYLLRATGNVQGDFLEGMGLRRSFVHLEIERHVRDEYHAGAGRGHGGIVDLLDAIAGELGGTGAALRLAISFQPPAVPPPAGHGTDRGQAFGLGSRAGCIYGWVTE